MTRDGDHSLEISLTLERREDGGLRVFSDDVPELFLSHRDESLVVADIVPALETILAAKLQKNVQLRHVLDEAREGRSLARGAAVDVDHLKYVVSVGEA